MRQNMKLNLVHFAGLRSNKLNFPQMQIQIKKRNKIQIQIQKEIQFNEYETKDEIEFGPLCRTPILVQTN